MAKIYFPEPLDGLFSLEQAAVTNIFGSPGTGKTNICILLAVECAKNGGKAAYIDTEGGFSVERVKQIADGLAGSHKLDALLDNIILIEPKTFSEQGKVVRKLAEMAADLVVLDSCVALYRLEHPRAAEKADVKGLTRAQSRQELSENNRELSRQLSILSNIAREKKIPVVVTAHTYKNWETGENEVVGGDPLKYWSKSMVFLEKTGKTSERKAIITKHRSQPEGKSVKFLIVEEGIKPSGFKIF